MQGSRPLTSGMQFCWRKRSLEAVKAVADRQVKSLDSRRPDQSLPTVAGLDTENLNPNTGGVATEAAGQQQADPEGEGLATLPVLSACSSHSLGLVSA